MSYQRKRLKVVMVTGMLPSGHYSQILTGGLRETGDVDLLVYTDKSSENRKIKESGRIIPTWSKSPAFIFQILFGLTRDKPDLIHFQHEFNMYGSMFTALLFPVLVLLTRLINLKTVVTVHAAPSMSVIDNEFVTTFNQNPKLIKPLFLKLFFKYIYTTIGLLSGVIVVHTNIIKEILVNDYAVNRNKIKVIPCAIPQKRHSNKPPEPYFLYFGYMVRRKGLGLAIEGFKNFVRSNPDTRFKLILAGGVIKGQEISLTEIQLIIKKNHIEDRVQIRGFIEADEQDNLYRNAYAVIIPAILSISSSGPLYHALSYGKCAIASKIGNFLEDIDDGKTGILVNNNRWKDAFGNAVKNKAFIKQIESNIKKISILRSPLKTAYQYLSIYETITERS